MKNEARTTVQLITELERARRRIADLEQNEEVLRDRAEEYRAIYENVPEVLIRVDKYGTIVGANDHSATFGRTPGDIIGKKFTELSFFDLKDIPKYWALFKDVITGRKTVIGMELEVKHKDGHKIPVEVNTSLFRKNGKIAGFLSVARDITERKKAEQEIRQRNDDLAVINAIATEVSRTLNLDEILNIALNRVLEAVQLDIGGIFFFDQAGKQLNLVVHRGISHEFEAEITKIDIDEKTLEVATRKGKRGDFIFSIEAVLKNRVELRRLNAAMKKENLSMQSAVPVLLHARETILGVLALVSRQPWQLSDAEQRLLTSIGQQIAVAIENARLYEQAQLEIAERKLTEEALRLSEEKFRLLFEHVPVGIYQGTPSGRLFTVNLALVDMLGYDNADEMRGDNQIKELYLDPEAWKFLFSELESKNELRNIEVTLKRKDGTPITALENVNAVRYKDGRIRYYEGMFIDITERKEAEEVVAQSREQLRNLSFHLQRIREEERRAIAREIHDELGQELTAIKMDLSWLNNKLPKDLQLLGDRVKGMTELVNSMIQTVKRITSELRPAVLDDLGVAAALEWEIGEFRKRTGYTCRLSIEPEEFELDPGRSTAVYRIFQESLTNIARHARASSVIVRLKAGTEELEMSIRDNGIGITKEQLESQESFGLIGIRERARQYGGEALITGTTGVGTIITVKIPYERDEDNND